jgi:hypothetical protein
VLVVDLMSKYLVEFPTKMVVPEVLVAVDSLGSKMPGSPSSGLVVGV